MCCVLHYIAICHGCDIDLTEDTLQDFHTERSRVACDDRYRDYRAQSARESRDWLAVEPFH
uniref:Uncharacterized protein n=1 Tax=Anguilla anguilla TaxID=7936 RepID=A0A0E9XPZ4_ANGAN